MSDPTADSARAQTEAAGWFARLSRTPVATQTVRDFQAWRQSPANDAAYSAVEKRWEASARLANDPDIRAATAEVLRKRPPRQTTRFPHVGTALLGAGLLAGCALAGWLVMTAAPTIYSTHVGEQHLVVLKDGSRVHLNTDSQVQVKFSSGERRVVLARGEAFFEAAHDAARPFIVEADGARIRAVGTKFDVRRGSAGVQVTLLEGRVQVGHTDQPNQATLLPNQQLVVTQASITAPAFVDGDQTASWTTGRLVFRGVTLATAIDEINRYTTRKIVLAGSSALANKKVSGSFDPGDPKAFVEAATSFYDLQADWSVADQIRLTPRAPTGA
jgi:transmembrane sensor